MSDRLEEIKNWLKLTKTGMFGGIRPSARARTYFTWLLLRLEQCKAENAELQAVFDLQATRTKKAETMWQQATGKHSTLPDLGVLLDWLMGEIKKLHENENVEMVRRIENCLEIAIDRAENAEDEVKRFKALLSYQGIPF